jgi:hypothetical protein
MAIRKRALAPDSQGRFRPRIGWKIGDDGALSQPRFNLGTDRKEAERRYAKIQELYEDNCRVNGEDVWSPLALSYAEELAKGRKTIQYPPLDDEQRFDDPTLEYAQMIDVNRQYFPSLDIQPADPELYFESIKRNQEFVAQRLKQLEAEMREWGALSSQTTLPDRLITGTFFEALDVYASDIRENGDKLENGDLKPYQRLRLHRVERFKREHADIPLSALNYDRCAEMVAYWRNRPVTLWGGRSSRDNARHHLGELFRFLGWLDVTPQFGWTLPRGVTSLNRKVSKLEGEKKLSAVTKPTYTVEQLTVLNKHATPLERMALYLGLNCALGAAELGRLVIDDFIFHRPHEFAGRLEFHSSEEDSFLRYFRPKTVVFGEWLLWSGTVPMVRWGVDRTKRLGAKQLFVWDTGKAIYDETMTNAQMGFANLWDRLIKRVRKSDPDFPRLPFGSLRDTLPDLIRLRYSDSLASLCLSHGSPSKADNLLECYANKPFGKLHEALRALQTDFAPVFDAVDDPFDETKSYLPLVVRERVRAMLAEGKEANEIVEACGVSKMTVHRERAQGRK